MFQPPGEKDYAMVRNTCAVSISELRIGWVGQLRQIDRNGNNSKHILSDNQPGGMWHLKAAAESKIYYPV